MELLEKFGSDAVRHWAASGRPGTDTAFEEQQIKIGRKLAIKVLNVSRFVLSIAEHASDDQRAINTPVDRALLRELADLVDEATPAFEGFDYARALERTERFFWSFCDDYVELVKGRAYGSLGEEAAASAATTLRVALSTLLRLFAPIMPFVTEEVWSWWQTGSIHRAAWPDAAALRTSDVDALPYTVAAEVLLEVRKAKSVEKRSLATPVRRVVIRDNQARLDAFALAESDVREAGKIAELVTEVADDFTVTVDLEPPAQ
jgi:valyl-tRNA synthetase